MGSAAEGRLWMSQPVTTAKTARQAARRGHHDFFLFSVTEAGGCAGGRSCFGCAGCRVGLLLLQAGSVVDGGDEAVADAGDGFDVARGVGGVAEGVAKFLDGFVEAVVEVDEDV